MPWRFEIQGVRSGEGECFDVVWAPTVSRRAVGDVSAVHSGRKYTVVM